MIRNFRKVSLLLCLGMVSTGIAYAVPSDKVSAANVVLQGQPCKGVVKDSRGETIIGASVVVKGTTNGTITDIDGNFTLPNVARGTTIQVSFVGYQTQEVVWNGTPLSITLKDDTQLLDEVVVVGFGTQKKVNLTGSVSTMNSEELTARPVTTVAQAMQGMVPGMNFSYSNGGRLDSNLNFDIHGTGTIGDGSNASPLILIDGAEGDLNAINPADIENISVLKDASASSIYGSRAAFGVVLVTTKKGKAGKTSVSYNNNFRFTRSINMPDVADSYTYARYFNLMRANAGQSPQFSDEQLDKFKRYMEGDPTVATADPNPQNPNQWWWIGNTNTDWYDVLYGDTSFQQEHNISASGGSEKIQYYLSANYLSQEGIIAINPEKLKRYTVTSKITAELFPWLKATYNLKYIRKDFTTPSVLDDESIGTLYHNTAKRWPMEPVYNPDGSLASNTLLLPLRDGGNKQRQTDYVYQQLQLVATPLENWNIYGELNYNTTDEFQHADWFKFLRTLVDGTTYWDESRPTDYAAEYASRNNYFNTNIYSDYSFTLNDAHNFKVMAGFQAELNKYRYLWGRKDDLITENVPNIATATGEDYVDAQLSHWATAGFFGRLNYDYKGRYLFEANIRYDGTSRFDRNQRWNWFPSFSAGWNIAQEAFWEPLLDYVNVFKLKGSWGELGNQNTKDLYPYILRMPFTANGSSWLINGLKPNISSYPGLGTSLLGWETMQSWNIGFELAMFRNRLTVGFDWFNRTTKDMVGPAPERPATLGTTPPKMNNAEMVSRGFDLEISWRDRIGEFGYGARFILSDARQKILDYPNVDGSLSAWRVGQYMNEIWGLETLGIAKTQEEMDAYLANLPNGGVTWGNNWSAGDVMYVDRNGDGKISEGSTESDPGDLTVIGNYTPRFNFGLDLNADWKGFDLRIFLQGTAKRDYWIGGNMYFGASGGTWSSSCFVSHLDFFTTGNEVTNEDGYFPENLDAFFPRPLEDSSKNTHTQTRYLSNASYLRIKNLQLGYTLPEAWTSKVGISRCRLFVSGENLFTITGLPDGFDPENLNNDGKNYPLSRNISFGLNVNF